MERKFTRCQEDFICEKCGEKVFGNGYTNHCPRCLYSKHVDVRPGDRKNQCLGLMEPIKIETGRKGHTIIHKCLKCGAIKRNRSSPKDSFEAILAISEKAAREARHHG